MFRNKLWIVGSIVEGVKVNIFPNFKLICSILPFLKSNKYWPIILKIVWLALFVVSSSPTCSLNSLARNDQNCLCPSLYIYERERGTTTTNHSVRNDFLQWRGGRRQCTLMVRGFGFMLGRFMLKKIYAQKYMLATWIMFLKIFCFKDFKVYRGADLKTS